MTLLAPVGGQRIMDFGEVTGYGVPPRPDFWIGRQAAGEGFRESSLPQVGCGARGEAQSMLADLV